MAVDSSGKWWIGDAPEDIRTWLMAHSKRTYPVEEFRLCRCDCGGFGFRLEADDAAGVARRTCAVCGSQHFICDSAQFWEDANPEICTCPECGSAVTNVGIGFALYPDKQDIKWIYVGVRCTQCGILGLFAGWKVGHGPSLHLMEQA